MIGSNALTFEVGDHQGLASAILRYIDDAELRTVTVSNARRSIMDFSLENHVSRLEEVYERLYSLPKVNQLLES